MQITVRCENTFKSSTNESRMAEFTDKWVKFINQSIKKNTIVSVK